MFQYIQQMFPVHFHRRDQQSLIRRVNATQGWPERDHIQVRILSQEQSTFQSGMNRTNHRLLTEETLVALDGDAKDLGMRIWFLSGIAVSRFRSKPTQAEDSRDN